MKVQITKITCLKCGHVWVPRKEEIKYCAFCKSTTWFEEKNPEERRGRKKKAEEIITDEDGLLGINLLAKRRNIFRKKEVEQ